MAIVDVVGTETYRLFHPRGMSRDSAVTPKNFVVGTLADMSRLLCPGSILHVDELMNERRTNEIRRYQSFYPADGLLYFMDGQTPKLAITREPDNLVLRHLDDAFTQLITTGSYRPDMQEATAAINSASTLVVDLTKLQLQGDDRKWQSMKVSTSEYEKLTQEQRAFAERVYGQGDDLAANMKMLKNMGTNEAKIFVFNPEYVRTHAQESAFGQACWLSDFVDSGFVAIHSDVNKHHLALGLYKKNVPFW